VGVRKRCNRLQNPVLQQSTVLQQNPVLQQTPERGAIEYCIGETPESKKPQGKERNIREKRISLCPLTAFCVEERPQQISRRTETQEDSTTPEKQVDKHQKETRIHSLAGLVSIVDLVSLAGLVKI